MYFNIRKLVVLIYSIFAMQSAFAQHGAGNNALVVEDNGKYYLLDFFEGGIQKQPHFGYVFKNPWNNRFLKRASTNLKIKNFDSLVNIELLANKLVTLSAPDRDKLLAAILVYDWRFVDAPVKKIDHPDSVLDLSSYKVYAAAFRKDKSIYISKKIFEQLDEANRIGLIIHEVIYALVRPTKLPNGFYDQNVFDARLLTREIFSQNPKSYVWNLKTFVRDGKSILSISNSFSDLYKNPEDYVSSGETLSLFNSTSQHASIDYSPTVLFIDDHQTFHTENISKNGSLDNEQWMESPCQSIMDRPSHSMTLVPTYLTAMTKFISYQTENGEQLYLSFEVLQTSFSYMKVIVKYDSLTECVSKFHDVLVKISDRLVEENYDFNEEYSKP